MENYEANPIDTSDIQLNEDLEILTELLAKNVHEVWAKFRISQGWKYGEERSDEKHTHPCLIPYEDLSIVEQDYDRNTAIETIKFIKKLGYNITKE